MRISLANLGKTAMGLPAIHTWGGVATDAITVKQTVLYGPHQANAAVGFWRTLSDSIVEVKRERVTMAAEYQLGVETVDVAGNPRALWSSAQLPVHWSVRPSWSVTLRPEFCWDRDGRWIGAPESVVAFTTTLEYRVPYRRTQAILRFEHRYDDSWGAGGGFFEDRGASLNVLTPGQHLLTAAAIVTFDSSARD